MTLVKDETHYEFDATEDRIVPYKMTHITVKSNGGMITKIPDTVFIDRLKLQTVIIEEGITTIGDGAFENCKNLVSIQFPSTLTTIGDAAFFACKNLRKSSVGGSNNNQSDEFSLPSSLQTIAPRAFFEAKSLTSVVIPPHVTKIEDETFKFCYSLHTVKFPGANTVQKIGKEAFYGCKVLNEIINFSNISAENINETAFGRCKALHNNPHIKARNINLKGAIEFKRESDTVREFVDRALERKMQLSTTTSNMWRTSVSLGF